MQTRPRLFPLAPLFAPLLLLGACESEPGEITRDTEPFSDIAESATISALGNEPFWGLTIEPDGEGGGHVANYSSPDNIDGTRFAVTRFAGNNGLGFSGEMEQGHVSLAITPGDCSDTMSDRAYPYAATLSIGEQTLFGCAYTSDQPFTGEETP